MSWLRLPWSKNGNNLDEAEYSKKMQAELFTYSLKRHLAACKSLQPE